MPFRTSAIGARYRAREVDLTARDLLSFAAGIDAPWPATLDDARPEGLTGFPTYCASLEFNAFQGGFETGDDPVGTSAAERRRGVHAGQDSVFHAPLRPGDRLSTTGTLVSVRETRAGPLVTLLAETRNRDTGAPVVTSWVSQILRDVPLDGEPREIAAPPAPPRTSQARLVRRTDVRVTPQMPHVYAGHHPAGDRDLELRRARGGGRALWRRPTADRPAWLPLRRHGRARRRADDQRVRARSRRSRVRGGAPGRAGGVAGRVRRAARLKLSRAERSR